MKAEDTLVTNLLEGAKQFIVPIFQRDYSWGTKHCQQLWKDGLANLRVDARLCSYKHAGKPFPMARAQVFDEQH